MLRLLANPKSLLFSVKLFIYRDPNYLGCNEKAPGSLALFRPLEPSRSITPHSPLIIE